MTYKLFFTSDSTYRGPEISKTRSWVTNRSGSLIDGGRLGPLPVFQTFLRRPGSTLVVEDPRCVVKAMCMKQNTRTFRLSLRARHPPSGTLVVDGHLPVCPTSDVGTSSPDNHVPSVVPSLSEGPVGAVVSSVVNNESVMGLSGLLPPRHVCSRSPAPDVKFSRIGQESTL